MIWYEVNIHKSVGRYLFSAVTQDILYWQLLGLTVLLFLVGWLLGRSRYGLALRAIGADETAASHSGIDATRVKLAVFVLSATFMSVTGAVMAPRWTYIDPVDRLQSDDLVSGRDHGLAGRRRFAVRPRTGRHSTGPVVRSPSATLPNHFSIVLGVIFVFIVMALPNGVIGLITTGRRRIPADGTATVRAADTSLLTVDGISKSFSGLRAVDGVSFTVAQGQIIGIIGPNGSGKTTLLNTLSGALAPSSGTIRLGDTVVNGLRHYQIARLGLARTFQLVRVMPDLTVAENVAAARLFRGAPASTHGSGETGRELLDLVGLGAASEIQAGELTYIDQKRLELARALALQPRLVLLDEWLAGLNPSELETGIALIAKLRDRGLTIIMVEHVMDAIRALCGHCIVMNAGSVIARGAPDEVLSDPKVVAAYLGGVDA